MFCSICENSKVSNSFTSGCTTVLKKESIDTHLSAKGPSSHKAALMIIENGNDMAKAREKSVSKSKESILSAMRNVMFMAEHDLPNSLLSDLNTLCLQQGAEQFKDLLLDNHTSYTHNKSVQEFQAAIAATVREDLRQRLSQSEYYSILLDESTDVSVDQNLIVYVRYIFCNR
ncbi:hypothetical protein SNE40_013681 [Patella caerulea]|uniref:DUF4371 domain-containing protein n=1 Tax=Patella caerulea TaxID=87958 RepID=A0AAN8JIP7_PATCE